MPAAAPTRKSAGDENFPVASRLLDRRVRPRVMAFYAAARAGDDIADDPSRSTAERLAALEAWESGLPADGVQHLRALGVAFRQDAEGIRCRTWEDLVAYCRHSAVPVGRFLLDVHDIANPAAQEAADALCIALQILNHLQDCRSDLESLDRVYLPIEWIEQEEASVDDLRCRTASPPIRRVLNRVLDGADGLLERARPLPRRLGWSRLALEAAVILAIAERLAHRLRHDDPLAAHVELSALERLLALMPGGRR